MKQKKESPFQEKKTLNARGKKEINLKEHERDKMYQSKITKEGSLGWGKRRKIQGNDRLLLKFRKQLVRQLELDDGGELLKKNKETLNKETKLNKVV